ncbi:MAG TPA: DUF1697 domain-containing protein [Thermoflexales bacterium]|nr:DUF1697 domain-containing protein [Thermoflexales bacterium]HQX09024.1 DUF1697 domain-containing protein [Thermoflexales bacterium]HQY25214.1 DUF1697 domain-containing protein [Thermoflexales bacterium]HQZ52047.1 DUF1697 domain-containing protein [Thermoflexales bacterium]
MRRYFAFLRAINVGGRNVTMAVLRNAFTSLGLQDVETFIASGNVIFASKSDDCAALESTIEAGLQKTLGYEVKTFLRDDAELAAIAHCRAFGEADEAAAHALYVGFLARPLSPAGETALARFKTDLDDFYVHGREVYWKSFQRQTDSKFSNAVFERTLKISATWRNVNTVQRLATKYGL